MTGRRTVEFTILDKDILYVAVTPGSELDAVAGASKATVTDDHIRHRKRLVALRLEAKRVVVRVNVASLDQHVRRLDVYAVVRIVDVVVASDAAHRDTVAVP